MIFSVALSMTLKCCFLCESSTTFTQEREFPRVHVKMISQVTRCWKRSGALATFVRFLLKMNHLVVVQVGAGGEALSAQRAFKWFLSCGNNFL